MKPIIVPEYPIMSSVFLGKAPELPPVNYDLEKRDKLFNELQQIKKIAIHTKEEKNRINFLEEEITNMLNQE